MKTSLSFASNGPREFESSKDLSVHIPKVISSFANTQGGIWIIGVTADKTTNRAILPIKGLTQDSGLEERITQSCYSNLIFKNN